MVAPAIVGPIPFGPVTSVAHTQYAPLPLGSTSRAESHEHRATEEEDRDLSAENHVPLAQEARDVDMIVFTAVFHTGGNPTPVHCMGWTDNSESLVPTGLATATDTGWTVTAPYFCSETHHIYCFEQ